MALPTRTVSTHTCACSINYKEILLFLGLHACRLDERLALLRDCPLTWCVCAHCVGGWARCAWWFMHVHSIDQLTVLRFMCHVGGKRGASGVYVGTTHVVGVAQACGSGFGALLAMAKAATTTAGNMVHNVDRADEFKRLPDFQFSNCLCFFRQGRGQRARTGV
jgi:hypothetical protein